MMNRVRYKEIQRLLAFAVGAVFLFSTVAANVGFCKCGVVCDPEEHVAAPEPLADEAHVCCGKTEPPEEQPASTESCPCPELKQADGHEPFAPAKAAFELSSPHTIAILPAVDSASSQWITAEAELSRRYTRGSPSSSPLHVLYSVYLI